MTPPSASQNPSIDPAHVDDLIEEEDDIIYDDESVEPLYEGTPVPAWFGTSGGKGTRRDGWQDVWANPGPDTNGLASMTLVTEMLQYGTNHQLRYSTRTG